MRVRPGTVVQGTCRPPSRTAPRGFYHAVEYLSATLQWRGLQSIEARLGRRTVDVLMLDGRRIELKNPQPGAQFSKFFAEQVVKDIQAAIDASGPGLPLAASLEKLEYVFRGRLQENVALVARLRAQIAASLGPTSGLASHVKITFLDKGVPF